MDIRASSQRVTEELIRELLIAISYPVPDKILDFNLSLEEFGSVDGFVESSDDLIEQYRSELISISYLQSTDAKY